MKVTSLKCSEALALHNRLNYTCTENDLLVKFSLNIDYKKSLLSSKHRLIAVDYTRSDLKKLMKRHFVLLLHEVTITTHS